MSSLWYYSPDGLRTLGPFTLQQMRELANSHTLQPMHSVRRKGTLDWTVAHEVSEIFSLAAPAANPASSNPEAADPTLPDSQVPAASTPLPHLLNAALSWASCEFDYGADRNGCGSLWEPPRSCSCLASALAGYLPVAESSDLLGHPSIGQWHELTCMDMTKLKPVSPAASL